MAIYHLHMQTISRADGRSAVAAAAYRAASRLIAADGRVFDFRRKQGVVAREIFVPKGCPAIGRQDLWLLAERTEKRKNSTLAREMDMAIPVELTRQERFKLTAQFCRWLTQEYQVAVDCCMHRKDKNDPQENPHIHVMFTTRRYTPEGTLGAKTRELDDLKTRKTHLLRIREKWADFCNGYLQFYGETIDHRSFKDQGIDALPQIHVGSAATTMARRGLETERGALNRKIQKNNTEFLQLQKEIENVRYLENGSGEECAAGIQKYGTEYSKLSEKIGAGGGQQRLGTGFGTYGFGEQGTAGSKSSTPENGQGGNTTIPFRAKPGGTPGGPGTRSRAVEDGCPASAARANRVERVAALEMLAQNCTSISREIQSDIHALVEAANLRCLKSSIHQYRLQRLKEPSLEVIVECWCVIKEILYAVDRVNAQAIHKALLLSAPQSSPRLITLDTKVKNIITVSQHIQQEIQVAVDGRNSQYIQEYLKRARLRPLKASCLSISAECDRTIREIFQATDRLDARFIEQLHARHSTTKLINARGRPLLKGTLPCVVRINLEEDEPSQWIESNGVIRTNLDTPETSGPDLTEGAPGNSDDTEINNAPT